MSEKMHLFGLLSPLFHPQKVKEVQRYKYRIYIVDIYILPIYIPLFHPHPTSRHFPGPILPSLTVCLCMCARGGEIGKEVRKDTSAPVAARRATVAHGPRSRPRPERNPSRQEGRPVEKDTARAVPGLCVPTQFRLPTILSIGQEDAGLEIEEENAFSPAIRRTTLAHVQRSPCSRPMARPRGRYRPTSAAITSYPIGTYPTLPLLTAAGTVGPVLLVCCAGEHRRACIANHTIPRSNIA